MILAIDAGNTRIKWGIFPAHESKLGELKANGTCLKHELEHAPLVWKTCERAVVSNVAGEQVGHQIHGMLEALKIPYHEAKSGKFACGVHNQYEHPEKLGIDRWAALIAAWHHYRQPCVVVNAGTALTIDVLDQHTHEQGIFLGGMILPGIRLMQQSLLDSTAGIKESMGEWEDFPRNTANALYTAAMTAAAGSVKGMAARLQRRAGLVPRLIISGGDADLLAACLRETIVVENNLVIADNLVLQGLVLLERESR